jgi:hypothetical protein
MGRTRALKLAVLVFFLVGVPAALAYSGGPPPAHTGAPGELSCRQCHNSFDLNSGPGEVRIEGVPAVYEPGETYTVTVRVRHPDRRRWGFQVSAYTDGLEAAGTFTITDAAHTQTVSADGITYVQHEAAGTYPGTSNGASWEFEWTAPGPGAGRVTFYAAGNAANNNSLPSGDNIYTTFAESEASTILPPFTDATARAGLSGAGGGAGVAWADFDLDGDQDFLTVADGGPAAFRNDAGEFTPADLGIEVEGGRAAAWGDADDDGRPDLFLATAAGPRLFRNTAGGFEDATAGLPASGAAEIGAWADYDGDGWLDLLLGLEGGLALLRNDRAGAFEDVTAAAGLTGAGAPRAAAWADYDGDGRADLFVATAGEALLFRQESAGVFAEAAAGVTGANGATDAVWVDFDGDLDLDLFVAAAAGLGLFANDGRGTFADVTAGAGLEGVSGRALAAGDSDGDGRLDVLVTGPGADRLLRYDGAQFVDDFGRSGLGDLDGQAVTWADFDGEGHADLLLLSATGVRLWRNPSSEPTVTVRAVTDADNDASDADTASDRDALGATVAIASGGDFESGAVQVRVISGGGSKSQPPPVAIFSAAAGAPVSVRATFADGEGRESPVTVTGAVSATLRDGRAARIASVTHKLKNGVDKLVVDGERFRTGSEVVEVDGRRTDATKYPKKKRLGGGISTRIVGTDANFGVLVPPGREVLVTSFDPATGLRSAPSPYTR